jgi:N-acetylglutamate synthase-like GNAT family acetyltransferase
MSELNLRIRTATAADERLIKSLINRAQLDPSNVHWKNFVVAEHEGEVIGIGQLKPYSDCTELGSLVTLKAYRGKGVAASIIQALEDKATFPLYLICRDIMESYYESFGYKKISFKETPTSLRLKLLFSLLYRLIGVEVIAMKKPSANGS